jgi:hypothetical protein
LSHNVAHSRLSAIRPQACDLTQVAIVAAVARLHGGSIRLEDNAPGLRAVLTLPLCPAAATAGVPLSAGAAAP